MFLCKVNSIDDSKINVWGYGSSSKKARAEVSPIQSVPHPADLVGAGDAA